MKCMLLCVYGIFLIFVLPIENVNGSFIYGQPCSERNTAYLEVLSWKLPRDDVKCVDITGFKKAMSGKINLANYSGFFQIASKADSLYSNHMNLTKFPISAVLSLPNLELIDLSGNYIRRIPNKMYKLAPNLRKLLIPNNKVKIPTRMPLIASSTLKVLMLSGNGIKIIFKFTFSKLPSLEILYLDDNNLRTITPMFNSIPNLKFLHLGKNYLTTIPPKTLVGKGLIHYITKSQRRIENDGLVKPVRFQRRLSRRI